MGKIQIPLVWVARAALGYLERNRSVDWLNHVYQHGLLLVYHAVAVVQLFAGAMYQRHGQKTYRRAGRGAMMHADNTVCGPFAIERHMRLFQRAQCGQNR